MEDYREASVKELTEKILRLVENNELVFWVAPDVDALYNFNGLGFGATRLDVFDVPIVAIACYGGDEVFTATMRDGKRAAIADAINKCIASEHKTKKDLSNLKIWLDV